MTLRTFAADHVLRDALLDHLALGRGKRVQNESLRAAEGAHVTGRLLALQRLPHFVGIEARIHRHHRLLVSEQQPVAIFFR
jgi:hypothetical protein